MTNKDKTKEELITELQKLQKDYDSLKKSCEENINYSKKSEDAFLKLLLRQEALLAAVPEIIMEVDNNKIYTWANSQGLNFFGKDVIGKEASFYFEGEQETYIKIQPLFDGEDAIFYVESWQHRYDGEKRLLAWWCRVLKDNEGNVKGALSSARDITENKQAGEALAKEQYLMDTLMNNLPDHIYFKDIESRFIRINKSHAQSLGLSDPAQAAGKTDFDLHIPDHARQAYSDEQTIIQTGQPLTKEERLVHPNSPDTWVIVTKLPLLNKEGTIIGTFGISRDITKRKKAEEELAAERSILRTLIDNIPEWIFAKDTKSRFTICNKALIRQLGKYDIEEIIGKTDFDFWPYEFASLYFADEQEIMQTGQPLIDHEETMGGSSGNKRWSLTTKVPLKDNQGNIVGIIGIGKDITDRKLVEEELKQSEERFRSVAQSATDAIISVDSNGNILGWNRSAEKAFGYTEAEVIGQSLNLIIPEEFKILHIKGMKRLQMGGEKHVIGKTVELLGLKKNGLVFPLELSLAEWETSEGVFFTGIIRDITKRKQAEEEIKLKNELLQAINAEKDKFFSILAHDLRGPLSAFVSATQIITEEIQTMGIEEIKEITGSMKTSATNIYRLLENLLEWSRLRQGGMDFIPVKFSLKEKIGACIDVLSESAWEKRIEIAIFIPDELEVFADNHMFDAIVRNLVSNAIKFTPVGGTVTIAADLNSDNSIEVKISDSGIGMTPELKSKLFLLNEKTSRIGTEGEPSTGLGLLLCKEFIEKHDGKIWVKSEDGKGSTFYFTIPDDLKRH